MKDGRQYAVRAGISIERDEKIQAFGTGWLISAKTGFEPCPWAFDLARFCTTRPGDRVLDLGAGVAPLLLALKQTHSEIGAVVGLELDQGRAERGRRNMTLNGLEHGVMIRGDVRELPLPQAFDLVVANPPFYPPGWGRQSANPEVASATHALSGCVGDFAKAAQKAVSDRGQIVFIFDASRLSELLLAISSAGLVVQRIRFLDDDRGKAARVLVQAASVGVGVAIERLQTSTV